MGYGLQRYLHNGFIHFSPNQSENDEAVLYKPLKRFYFEFHFHSPWFKPWAMKMQRYAHNGFIHFSPNQSEII
jgi:hypothetical protein